MLVGLHIVFGCFFSTTQLSSYDKDYVTHIWPFTKNRLLILTLQEILFLLKADFFQIY